jgi:hypothetical protein
MLWGRLALAFGACDRRRIDPVSHGILNGLLKANAAARSASVDPSQSSHARRD